MSGAPAVTLGFVLVAIFLVRAETKRTGVPGVPSRSYGLFVEAVPSISRARSSVLTFVLFNFPSFEEEVGLLALDNGPQSCLWCSSEGFFCEHYRLFLNGPRLAVR